MIIIMITRIIKNSSFISKTNKPYNKSFNNYFRKKKVADIVNIFMISIQL